MVYQKFRTSTATFNSSSDSQEILLYECGNSPGNSLSIPPEDYEVNSIISNFNLRCFFPTNRRQLSEAGTTFYYANRVIQFQIEPIGSSKIPFFEFSAYSSARSYYFDIIQRFKNSQPLFLSQGDKIYANLLDIGDGLLSDSEAIHVLLEAAEFWGELNNI